MFCRDTSTRCGYAVLYRSAWSVSLDSQGGTEASYHGCEGRVDLASVAASMSEGELRRFRRDELGELQLFP